MIFFSYEAGGILGQAPRSYLPCFKVMNFLYHRTSETLTSNGKFSGLFGNSVTAWSCSWILTTLSPNQLSHSSPFWLRVQIVVAPGCSKLKFVKMESTVVDKDTTLRYHAVKQHRDCNETIYREDVYMLTEPKFGSCSRIAQSPEFDCNGEIMCHQFSEPKTARPRPKCHAFEAVKGGEPAESRSVATPGDQWPTIGEPLGLDSSLKKQWFDGVWL